MSVEADVSAEALPVVEGPGPEVVVEFSDDGVRPLLSTHGCLFDAARMGETDRGTDIWGA